MMKTTTLCIGLALTAALAACGDDPAAIDAGPPAIDAAAEPDAAPPGLTIDDVPEGYAEAYCGLFTRCGQFESAALCESLFGALIGAELGQIQAAVDDGRITFDGVAALACVTAFGEASCDRTAADQREDPAACDDVFVGTVAIGGTCYGDEECAGDSDCNQPNCPDACCPGTCEADPVVGLGGSCAVATCEPGTYCDGTATCSALLAADAACTFDDQCGYGLACQDVLVVLTGANRTCRPLPARGQPCPTNRCANIADECLGDPATCQEPAGVGESCLTLDCKGDLDCGPADTCVVLPSLGQACTGRCGQGYCDGTTEVCTAQLANGQACTDDEQCTSFNCGTTTCEALPVCPLA